MKGLEVLYPIAGIPFLPAIIPMDIPPNHGGGRPREFVVG